MWQLQLASSYLTLLYSIFEEIVQKQVLQVSISVKCFFDFTQKDAVWEDKYEKC